MVRLALLMILGMAVLTAAPSAFAQGIPDAAAFSFARATLMTSIAAAKTALLRGDSPDDKRRADLLEIEAGARQAGSPEAIGRWQARFDSWARKDPAARPYALLAGEPVRGRPQSEEELRMGNILRVLENMNTESFANLYDGAASHNGPSAVSLAAPPAKPAAPRKTTPGARPLKRKTAPPVSPESNPEAVIAAAAVLPRGYWDDKKHKRVSVSTETQLEIARIAVEEAELQGQDPILVLAFVSKESAFNAEASGPFGEFGLMQLMPETARILAKQSPDMEALVRTSTHRLKDSARSCDLLAAKFLDAGKIVLRCGKAAVAATAPSGSPKKTLKADYLVEYLDLHDPRTNIRLGVGYIKSLWDKFSRIAPGKLVTVDPHKRLDLKEVISAYNAGAPAVSRTVARYGRPPHATEDYVDSFIDNYYLKLGRRFQVIAKAAAPRAAASLL